MYQRSIIQSVLKYSMRMQLDIALHQTLLSQHVVMLTSNSPYLNDSILLGEALVYAACPSIGQVEQK
jgi:hypothetical protein